jgi:hypothetical protein
MTDRDVVERAATMLARRVWRSDRGVALGYKPAFLTSIKGAAAVRLMIAVRPVMGLRRQAQIDRALARPHATRIRWHRRPSACSVTSCQRTVRVRGLCKLHYHLWWKSNKRGRASRYVPIDPPPPAAIDAVDHLGIPSVGTPQALAWLAGLLEGEGTFEALREREFTYPRISVSMCDEDIVQRVSAILDSKSVWRQEPRQDNWSATYGTALTGARAAEFMAALLHHMGQRRSAEIERALALYRPIRLSPRVSCTVSGCDAPHDSRGLCHRHHMQWWRDVRAGRAPRVASLSAR